MERAAGLLLLALAVLSQLSTSWATVSPMQSVLDNIQEIKQVLLSNVSRIEDVLQKVEGIDEKIAGLQKTCSSRPACEDRLMQLDNGYYLAFRITPGVGSSAWAKYTAVGRNDDSDCLLKHYVPPGCTTTDGRRFCDRHYRSKLLDLWDRLPIATVRVGLYKNNVEQRYFEFSASGTNYRDWFRQSRLINDSYTDLSPTKPTPLYFSIEGDGRYNRRFFIHNNYGGCHVDSGWLVVVDTASPVCQWERADVTKSYPYILYSTGTALSNSNNGATVGFADALVISVKLETQGN